MVTYYRDLIIFINKKMIRKTVPYNHLEMNII
jgi:hypothetical protein